MKESKNVILRNVTKEFKGHNNEGIVRAVDNISLTIKRLRKPEIASYLFAEFSRALAKLRILGKKVRQW